jgi:hypothetical protein
MNVIDKIPKELVEKAAKLQPEIKQYLADAPMGLKTTAIFALWHVQQVDVLEKQLANMREEFKT